MPCARAHATFSSMHTKSNDRYRPSRRDAGICSLLRHARRSTPCVRSEPTPGLGGSDGECADRDHWPDLRQAYAVTLPGRKIRRPSSGCRRTPPCTVCVGLQRTVERLKVLLRMNALAIRRMRASPPVIPTARPMQKSSCVPRRLAGAIQTLYNAKKFGVRALGRAPALSVIAECLTLLKPTFNSNSHENCALHTEFLRSRRLFCL